MKGQRPGDQPYRLEFVDGHLIVGWEEIYAVDIASGESTLIGEATIFVLAAESDRAWLIDYSGGRIGSGGLQVWQVSVFGEVLTTPVEIETSGFPAIGVPGGLAIESDSGISILDPARGSVVELGSGASFISDVTVGRGSALAWCSDPCDEFHVTELISDVDQVFTHPGQRLRFVARSARFLRQRVLSGRALDDPCLPSAGYRQTGDIPGLAHLGLNLRGRHGGRSPVVSRRVYWLNNYHRPRLRSPLMRRDGSPRTDQSPPPPSTAAPRCGCRETRCRAGRAPTAECPEP